MDWRLLGLIPVAHAQGPDVSRSAAARAAAEAVWVPTTLLPRFGVAWTATDEHQITASYALDGTDLEVRYTLDGRARVRSVAFDRWGDPDSSGKWGLYPAGLEVTGTSTFQGLTIPSAGSFGWFFGTDRWPVGEFFRFELTGFHLVTAHPAGPTQSGRPRARHHLRCLCRQSFQGIQPAAYGPHGSCRGRSTAACF